jgi:hypothetical protein
MMVVVVARVLRQASWWPAGILVLYVTSRFMENKNLFAVVLVISVYIPCVYNWERPSWLL